MQKPNQPSNPNKHVEFSIKETYPHIGSSSKNPATNGDRQNHDLVERIQYLYMRVVKAKDLVSKGEEQTCNPFVEVKLGNYKGCTRHVQNTTNPSWNQVFAFSKDRIQESLVVEAVVKDKKTTNVPTSVEENGILGRVLLDLNEIPNRLPPDSPLAPQWHIMETMNDLDYNAKGVGELMLAVWFGTQADEDFPDAWHLDVPSMGSEDLANLRSKVYISPKLWYLRVNVIEALDLQTGEFIHTSVKAILGSFVLRSKGYQGRTPMWNEDLVFVAAEPFQEPLILSVEDKVADGNQEVVLGKCTIPLANLERRMDSAAVTSRWYVLEKPNTTTQSKNGSGDQEQKREVICGGKIHLRICLEGGYHVLDELTHYSSDLRATAKALWKPNIGVLELGILSATDLPNENKGTTNAYCVAKYGPKWVRTRTVINNVSPKWNEQYTWEIFDPCTVITIAVFYNRQMQLQGGDKDAMEKDLRIGKVRIRLSALQTNSVYTHSYPLVVLQPTGVNKKGEIQLAIRFSSYSLPKMLQTYTNPILPDMHYLHPLTVYQIESLRHQATQLVTKRLSRAEPPLRKEVVEYMLDIRSNMWSARRSKANFGRIMVVMNVFTKASAAFESICWWKNSLVSALINTTFLVFVIYPSLILPLVFILLFLIGIWRFKSRPTFPPHMDAAMSRADVAQAEELEEEFDSFPTSCREEKLRMRYDRLRSVAGKVQTVVGDLATQGERVQSLLNWRDPRATALFLGFCWIAAMVLFVIPFRVVVLVWGFYVMRHPRFRQRLPSAPLNFFRRLPARTDCML